MPFITKRKLEELKSDFAHRKYTTMEMLEYRERALKAERELRTCQEECVKMSRMASDKYNECSRWQVYAEELEHNKCPIANIDKSNKPIVLKEFHNRY